MRFIICHIVLRNTAKRNMDNGKRTTSAAKGPGEPLRPAGRTARTGSGQHDAVPCLLGHDVPVRHLDGLVRGNAGASVAADHLPGVWYANLFTAFFGFFPRGFFSTDYFPLLPWLFLFWAGYFLHFCMGRARMEPLRRSVCPALGWMGRHSLLLYLLHQPVIYGVLSAAAVLFA